MRFLSRLPHRHNGKEIYDIRTLCHWIRNPHHWLDLWSFSPAFAGTLDRRWSHRARGSRHSLWGKSHAAARYGRIAALIDWLFAGNSLPTNENTPSGLNIDSK